MYQPIGLLPGRPGAEPRYGAFLTLTDEGARQELLEQFAAVTTKVNCTPCNRCKGRGYLKADLNVGCHECHGRGVHDHG